ncbi:butyrophilin-like protein 1 isoform X3 [Marmota monax]|uniref:butyrophilin-like protein 1 isoform X3 n=1 Tax=Marmota monax TaxID=9995 RepID=UPI0026EF8374|nr:butyrophilin-like protein 1 isoform X3 [Marmota monax]
MRNLWPQHWTQRQRTGLSLCLEMLQEVTAFHRWENREEALKIWKGTAVAPCSAVSLPCFSLSSCPQVRVSDNGMYTCFFRHGGFYEEADLEVKVAGMGSDPQVHIEGPEEDGVRLVCKASGWFPKPQVQWRDLSGNKFPALSETHSQDTEELFSVEATLVVRDSSVGNVTCSVLNPVLGQEKAMAIYIPEPFFPQASPWKPAFAVILTMLGLLLLGACYFIRKAHSRRMQVRQEKEHQQRLKKQEQQAKEEVLKTIDELKADLNQRKAAYLSAWRKAPLYAVVGGLNTFILFLCGAEN